LEVHPWADDRPMKDRQRRGATLRETWRDQFEKFAAGLRGGNVYVTMDLEWALEKLRGRAEIIGGDICGAYSEPKYARWKQKFASNWDHPKLALPNADEIRKTNFATLERLWPA